MLTEKPDADALRQEYASILKELRSIQAQHDQMRRQYGHVEVSDLVRKHVEGLTVRAEDIQDIMHFWSEDLTR